jgi:large repetitive protein
MKRSLLLCIAIFAVAITVIFSCKRLDVPVPGSTCFQITRLSAAGTDSQTVAVNTAIIPIRYTISGNISTDTTSVDTVGVSVVGTLPPGITSALTNGVFILSGTPTSSVGSPFTYTLAMTGKSCNTTKITGTIVVTDCGTITLTSALSTTVQTVALNANITPITYSLGGGATGTTMSGGPAGVSGALIGGIYTVSGKPTSAAGSPFTYTITTTGGACTATAKGTITVTAAGTITPTFTAIPAICIGSAVPALPPTSTNGITGSWSPATVSNISTKTYVFTPTAGQNATTTILVQAVSPQAIPTFSALPVICTGGTVSNLVITSTNAITGAWTPATINNTSTGTYLFTPTAGQCATTTNIVQVVNPGSITPTFASLAIICSGSIAPVLPNISLNAVTGTWSPSVVSDIVTNVYTFTPAIGQCATMTTLTQAITAAVIPTFTPLPAICNGSTVPTLPTTSTNGITGTWSPATVSNTASGVCTFTPTAGQCAVPTTLSQVVNAMPTIFLLSGSPSPTLSVNTAMTNIVYAISSGATSVSLSLGSFPTGVNGILLGSNYTIGGIPTATGINGYGISATEGACTTSSIGGTITVTP